MGMLEQRLQPILTQLRSEERERTENFDMVKSWFQAHTENLADDLADIAFVCELPREERTLLTYPVIGNWYLGKMDSFNPQTQHQEKVLALLTHLTLERRFNNCLLYTSPSPRDH